MENSYRFFANRGCIYFPCHSAPEPDSFNCLFCYCPLYFLGDACGGNHSCSGEKKIKNCMDCCLPHKPEYYDVIIAKLKEAANITTNSGG